MWFVRMRLSQRGGTRTGRNKNETERGDQVKSGHGGATLLCVLGTRDCKM